VKRSFSRFLSRLVGQVPLHRLGAALLPVRDEIGEELHARHPALERPKRSSGKRFTTPPKTSARAKAWLAAAKWPM